MASHEQRQVRTPEVAMVLQEHRGPKWGKLHGTETDGPGRILRTSMKLQPKIQHLMAAAKARTSMCGIFGCAIPLLALLLMLQLVGTADAAPIYTASAVACSNPFGMGSSPQSVSTGPLLFCGGSVSAAASANAGFYGVGASAQGLHVCCGGSGGGQGFAQAETEVIFTGPDPTVDLSLNLSFHGELGGGIPSDPSGASNRMIQLDIFVGSNHFISTFYDFAAGDGTHTSSQTGNLVFQASGPTVCPTACPGVTPTINAPTNTPILFRMSILAGVDGFLGTSFGFAEASNTLYFPLTGPVFNLPAGFSASIAGLSVEDNRVVGLDTGGGGSVPEPATCGLVGAGLALAALFRRRR